MERVKRHGVGMAFTQVENYEESYFGTGIEDEIRTGVVGYGADSSSLAGGLR